VTVADPITPEDRSRNLAAARALIMKGGPGGVVPRDTALMIIDVAEAAGLEVQRLGKKVAVLNLLIQGLDEKLVLNLLIQGLDEKLVANSVGVDVVKRLRVGLVVIQDIAVTTISNQFLNEAGAKAALHEILAVIEGVTK
jgi:hypothetical protein